MKEKKKFEPKKKTESKKHFESGKFHKSGPVGIKSETQPRQQKKTSTGKPEIKHHGFPKTDKKFIEAGKTKPSHKDAVIESPKKKSPLVAKNISKPFPAKKETSPENKSFIYGKHPVIEALREETPINKVWFGEHTRDIEEIISSLKDKGIPYKFVNKSKLIELVGETTNHQGVIAEILEHKYTELSELIELCSVKNTFFVVLDKLEDPHNLGAIIRTADAAGVDGIIIPKHRAVGITGTVSKTSAGSLHRMKICRVPNIAQVLEVLKENNVWIAGVDMDCKDIYSEANLKGSIALVLGGEGQGLSKLIKEKCDFIVKIPMHSKINSLNVSVASALLIYEVYRQRGFSG